MIRIRDDGWLAMTLRYGESQPEKRCVIFFHINDKRKLDLSKTMNLPKSMKVNRLIAILVLTVLPLVSISQDSGQYLGAAQSYFDKGEYDAAVIQLKNALLVDPGNGQARLLLGKVYLKLGDGPSAQKEFSRALEIGVSREALLDSLRPVLLMTGTSDELLELFSIEDDDPVSLRVKLLLLQGQAHLASRRFQLANDKFSEALELDPVSVEALLGKARIAHQDKDNAKVAELVDRALARDKDNADAWTLKGELLRAAGQPQEAMSAFQRALDIAPDNVFAGVGKASTLIMLGAPDKALEEIDRLQQRYPQFYLVHYFKALTFFQQQQLEPAQESVQRTLKQAPGHLPSYLLAGTIAYQQGRLNKAEQHLRKYHSQVPDNTQVTKLLAATLLKKGEADKAVEVLEAGAASAADDAQILALLGEAYLARGEASRGMEYMEKAVTLAPDVAALRTQLAIGQLMGGDVDQAVTELQAAVDLQQGLFQADLMLVMVYLKEGNFDKALGVAEALVIKMPDSPVALNLKGAALLGNGNRREAKNAFEAAVRMQPEFVPAHLNLAQLEGLEGGSVSAEARYQKVLSYDAGNLKALIELAALAEGSGRLDEAENRLKEAHERHPGDIKPALALVEYYLRQNDAASALEVASETVTAKPRDPAMLRALAMTQLRVGEDKAALTTLQSLAEVAPKSAEAHYLLAVVQLKRKQDTAARGSLQRALALQADYPAAQLVLGRLDIAEQDFDAASALAAMLQKAHPDAAYGDELRGDVHASRKEYVLAGDAYAQAYNKLPSALLAKKRYQSRRNSGNTDRAHEALRQWLAEQPDDVAVRGVLAASLQAQGLNRQAVEEYLMVLERDPNNVTALNNIAWLYQDAGNPEGVKYAERAHALVPGRAEITDTLGWLLVQNGDVSQGLVLLQEAAAKAPHIPDIRYHMIVALDKAGRRDEAREALDRLLKSGKAFSELDEAKLLREQWGR